MASVADLEELLEREKRLRKALTAERDHYRKYIKVFRGFLHGRLNVHKAAAIAIACTNMKRQLDEILAAEEGKEQHDG